MQHEYFQDAPRTVEGKRLGARIAERLHDVLPTVRAAKWVAHNTIAWVDCEGVIRIRLWFTDILTFNLDGTVSIRTGGWDTMTTRARLNAYLWPLGWRIWRDRGKSYISRRDEGFDKKAPSCLRFEEGMSIVPDYNPADPTLVTHRRVAFPAMH